MRGAGASELTAGSAPSSSSGVMSTARALEPSLGPTTPRLLEQVHEAPGPGEADPQLALQHGGGAELGAHDEVPGLRQQLVVVVVDAVAARAGRRRCPRSPTTGSVCPPWARQCATTSRTSSSETHGAWRRRGMLDEAVSRSMSPLPISRSAPGWSRMTRLSASEETEKAMRLGMLALITPVMTSTDGRWVAITRWMPTARAIWAMRTMESSTSRAATIMRSFSSSTTTRMKGSGCGGLGLVLEIRPRRRPPGCSSPSARAADLAACAACRTAAAADPSPSLDQLVVAGDVAHPVLGQQVVAALHLLDRPGQRVGRLLGVDDHRGEQVRQAVVLAQLDALGVDQDQLDLVRGVAHEDRRDERVDARRLARARSRPR